MHFARKRYFFVVTFFGLSFFGPACAADLTGPTTIKINSCGGSWAYTTNFPTPSPGSVRFVLTLQDNAGASEVDLTFQPNATALTALAATQSGTTWAVSLQAPQTDQDNLSRLVAPGQIYYIELGLNPAGPTPVLSSFTITQTGKKC